MDLDASTLIAGFLVSSAGFVLFTYGRKMQRLPQLVAGLLLMIFPYFAPSVLWMLLGAAAILGGLWLLVATL